jgi:hypothetical protein
MRGDIEASIDATARALAKDYKKIKQNSNFKNIMTSHGIGSDQENILASLFTINAHNSGV